MGTHHQPHSACSCELALRAVGAARGRPGGSPPAWVWGVRGRALSHPRLPALWAGCRGPLPTGCGCGGGAGVGTRHQPHSARSCELALRAVGAARGCPGGSPPAWVWGVRGRALSHPRLPALWAGCRGPLPTGCGCRGVRAWGPVTNPRGARSCKLAMRAVGAARERPGGAPHAWVLGVRGWALSHPRLPALRAGCRGPSPTGCGCGGVRAWDPVTNPTARALASWLCALWGRHEGAQGGRLLPGCGASGVGRSPTPDCPPSGRAAGAHHPLAVGVGGWGRGDPSPTPQRAPLRAGFARCGGGMRVPGGGASCLGVGHPGSGALPAPTARPLGGLPGPTTHWLWVRGGAGVETRHQPHSARSCELALRAIGAARGCPAGAPPAWVWGVRGRALSHPRLPALWAGYRGPLPTGCGCGGVRAWGPVTNPTVHSLACCGGRMRVPRGGASCLGVGRPGAGALPPPTACRLGRLPGPTTHWLWVRGGYGRGDLSPTPQRALLRAGFARCGGGTRAPGGGAFCLGVGRPGSGALPPPTARPLGGLPGPTTHWLWVRGGVRAWGPVTNPTAHSLACCGGGTRAPGGVASCLGVGRPGSGALPPPTARPLGGLPGPTTHWLWVRGGAGVGTRHQPHSARSCELALRAVGAARGRPGGAPLAWVWGVRGRALSHPRLPALWAGCRGPLPTGCGCGGMRAWGPVTNPTAGALANWLCALWRRHVGAQEGRLLPWCGASGVGRSPTPDCPPSGRAAGAHYPLAVGAGGCGRGDPSPTPQCALLRAVGAACRCPGGSLPAWVWGVRGGALSHPRLPALWAGCRGPLPTGCGCGGVRAWRPVTNPTARALASWLCAVWGRNEGAREGAPPAWVWGVRGRALSHSQLPALWAGCRGPLPTGCGCGGVRVWGPVTNPTAHSLACCGDGMSVPGGVASCLGVGIRGRALSHPRLPALWAGCRGPLPTGCGCGGVRAWGPVTNPTARALVSWLCALWGRNEAPGGGASCLGLGRPGSGALPPPTARPLGGLPGPTTHWLWVRGGAGVGTRHHPHSALSCVLWGRHVGARGGASCLGVGRPGSGALPPPTARPLGGLPGPTTHWLCMRGGAGVGTRHQPHSARSCELALRAVGAARGRPGGAPPAWVWGVRGRALSHPRLPSLWAGRRGPLPTGSGCRGVRAWGPVTNCTARALASWLCALWGLHEGARGGCLLPGCGASGVGRSTSPDCLPSGRAAGVHYPLAVGAGGCGRGDPSPTPQRALLRAGFARCGGGTRAPGGGASCLGVGRPGSGALPPPTARPLGGLPGPTTHWLWVRGGVGFGWVGSRPRLVAYPRSAPPSLRDPTGRPYPGVRSQGPPDC